MDGKQPMNNVQENAEVTFLQKKKYVSISKLPTPVII
jgi:hypothetical protein